MPNINYYFEEKPYWDKEATRFEENGKKVARYRMPCVALTIPYTPLTWLMANFIHSYYLSDKGSLEGGRGGIWKKKRESTIFWKRAFHSGIYQYELRINSSPDRKVKKVLENVIEIYRKISQKGFNTAKPVPVTENIRGEIVPLKGAKRIASLLALGVEWVPVLEYDRTTLQQIPPEQNETACINHSELIFGQLTDLAEVQSLKLTYDYWNTFSNSFGWFTGRGALTDLVIREGRENHHNELLQGKGTLTKYVDTLDLVSPPLIAMVLGSEVEFVLWLLKRAIQSIFIIFFRDYSGVVLTVK